MTHRTIRNQDEQVPESAQQTIQIITVSKCKNRKSESPSESLPPTQTTEPQPLLRTSASKFKNRKSEISSESPPTTQTIELSQKETNECGSEIRTSTST